MKRIILDVLTICFMLCEVLWAQAVAPSEEPSLSKPVEGDRCPVCGMFVAKYPDWTAGIVYRDGAKVFFDGPKDMFKYFLNLSKYAPEKSDGDIAAVYVTEYYDMNLIDASKAFFVIGSDIFGPMGRELIPFKDQTDAEMFKKDHKGERIVRFDQVLPATINRLD